MGSIYDQLFEPKTNEPEVICLNSVESKPLKFLWHPYLAVGKVTLMIGDPGMGKTMLCLSLAALVSRGDAFPGNEDQSRAPATVLYQTAEDGIADTIKPRLEWMHANLANIYTINEIKESLTLSDERIQRALESYRPALMIIDPLQAYLGADVDMNRANHVRSAVRGFAALAEQYGCAVILVMHMSKASQAKPLYRMIGSMDFAAIGRSMLVVGCNPNDRDEKILAHEKSNLSDLGESIIFHIDPDHGIVFDGISDFAADQIIGLAKRKGRNDDALKKAVTVLKEILKEKRYANLEEISRSAVAAGVSERTMQRAKNALGLKRKTIGLTEKTTWWMYPDVDETEVLEKEKGVL